MNSKHLTYKNESDEIKRYESQRAVDYQGETLCMSMILENLSEKWNGAESYGL
jgi:hypothetical protein